MTYDSDYDYPDWLCELACLFGLEVLGCDCEED